MTDHIADFFAFARERHAIYLRRRASLPAPWTQDPILQKYSFTNVFRQLDKTTQWYTEHVRTSVDLDHMLLATVVYRWFNRIRTGEAIFERDDIKGGWTAWQQLVTGNGVAQMGEAIRLWCGDGPYVTGAYIIKTPDGYSKLDGVLHCIDMFTDQVHEFLDQRLNQESLGRLLVANHSEVGFSLESVWRWLRQFPFLGDFMAYEIVTDLRWSVIQNASDIMTWANPGPGATRGIGRVFHGDKNLYNQHRDKDKVLIPAMRILLDASKDAGLWPQRLPHMYDNSMYTDNCEYDRRFGSDGDWPAWEMRDVEHTLCEFDKYERARTGEGRPRGTFHGGR